MIKKKVVFAIITTTILSISLIGCNNKNSNEDKALDEKNSIIVSDNSNKNETSTPEKEEEVNVNPQETDTSNSVSKIKGRKEFLDKLDKIQKELDEMPEKKDSDAGITNAMKNYYGKSYEEYDKALNEIYTLLKENLSEDVMEDLESKQIEWINQKETAAREEEAKYKGGTFEFVAGYISLYESTKEKCYELVNEYMED